MAFFQWNLNDESNFMQTDDTPIDSVPEVIDIFSSSEEEIIEDTAAPAVRTVPTASTPTYEFFSQDNSSDSTPTLIDFVLNIASSKEQTER